jgi:hypothetical protein
MRIDLSFQEKSLWLMLAGVLGAFGFYFSQVWRLQGVPWAADVAAPHVGLFAATVAILVIVSVVGHVAIALANRTEALRGETDERDRLIGLRGTRNAACVLATGVFLALCTVATTRGNFIASHVLLASWVLAQLVDIATRLALYRRGA